MSQTRWNINEGILYQEDGVNLYTVCLQAQKSEMMYISTYHKLALVGWFVYLLDIHAFMHSCIHSFILQKQIHGMWEVSILREQHCSRRKNKQPFQGACSSASILTKSIINHWKIKQTELYTLAHCQTLRHGKGFWEWNLGSIFSVLWSGL